MDALTLIKNNMDVHKILEHYDFDKVRPDGMFSRACCKIHGGDNPSSFVINNETGLYFCHTQCGGGDVFTLAQRLEGIGWNESVRRIADILGIDIENLQIHERQEEYIDELKKWIRTMKKRKKRVEIGEYRIREEVKSVTKFRDFAPSTLEHFGLGYVQSVELSKKDGTLYNLNNRLVFPIVQNGIQVGVSLRRVKNSDVPKWSHQPAHIETKNILYNFDAVQSAREIVVCEGIVDVWAYFEIGIDAVATFGAHLTEEQYRLLMQTGANVVWSYDNDEAGQIAHQKAFEMMLYKADQYKVELPEGADPSAITREELWERYETRRRIG